VHQLRLAMEEASGIDLNWFFDQWYYGAGHPVLDIDYKWDDTAKTETVYIRQTQGGKPFILPVAIDVYCNGNKDRCQRWIYGSTDTFVFYTPSEPQLVNVDADKMLVAQKKDNKTIDQYAFQYFHAPLFIDRNEAIEAAATHPDEHSARSIIISALTDKFSGIRSRAISVLSGEHEEFRNVNPILRNAALPVLTVLARTDSNTLVRVQAILALAVMKDSNYLPVFTDALNSTSYQVQAAALYSIGQISPVMGMQYAKRFETDNAGPLTQAMANIYAAYGGAEQWRFVYDRYVNASLQDKIHLTKHFAAMTGRIEAPAMAQQGISVLRAIAIKYKKEGAATYITGFLNTIVEQRLGLKDQASAKAATDAIREINEAP